MKRSPLNFLKIISLTLTTLFLFGCSQIEKIRVGFNSWPGYEFLYLSKVKGFDKAPGLEPQIVVFNSLADGRRSFERGEIDLLGTTVVEALFIKNNTKLNPKIVHVFDYSDGADVILVQSKYKSLKELKGKTVGVETGSVCIYVLYLGLQKNGLKLSDVKIVEADQNSIVQGLKNKTLDAGVTYPPFSINLLKNNELKVAYSSKESNKKIADVLIAQEALVQNRKADLRHLLEGVEKAKRITFNPSTSADAIGIMAKRENISDDDFKAAIFEDIHVVSSGEQDEFFQGNILSNIISETLQALKSTGQLDLTSNQALSLINEVRSE